MSPPVTIGMPVYNGADYIEQALGALLGQTYRSFTLLVSDNASDDGTWEILQDWAARDPRIALHRQERNIGALPNFYYVLDRAETEYFMWHAHDDWLAPNYLEEMVALMSADPQCALACGAIQPHVEEGAARTFIPALDLTDANTRLARIAKMLRAPRASWVYGLFQREQLRRALQLTEDFGYVWANDRLIILWFVLNDSLRGTDATTLYMLRTRVSVEAYRPNTVAGQGRFICRYLRLHLRLLRASRLPLGEKLLLLPWLMFHAARTTGLGNYKRFLKYPFRRFVRNPVKRLVKVSSGGSTRALHGRRSKPD